MEYALSYTRFSYTELLGLDPDKVCVSVELELTE